MATETYFPKLEERKLFWINDGKAQTVPGRKLLTDGENGNTFAVVSNIYKPTPHEEMLGVIEDVIKEVPEYGDPKRFLRTYNDGARMKATYIFEDVEVDVGGKDRLHPKIDLYNSYDLGWSRAMNFGAYRLVCKNGLTIGERVFAFRERHVTPFNREEVKNTILMAMEKFSDEKRIWNAWMDRKVLPAEYERVMETLPLTDRDVKLIGEEVEVSSDLVIDDLRTKTLTMWIFYNILAQYITHRIQSENRRYQLENAARRAFQTLR